MTRPDATSVEKVRKQQAIEELKGLSENALKEQIVLPLFRKRGLRCTSVDKRHEGQHRCDILMESDAHQDSRIDGAQLKVNVNILTKQYVRREIERSGAVALTFDHRLTDGTLTTLSKYYWITTGEIGTIGNIGLNEVFGKGSPYLGRVEVWGVERLVAEIQKTAPELLPPLELLRIEQSIGAERDSVVAAYWCYEAFRWQFKQPGRLDLQRAEKYLEDAGSYLSSNTRRHWYYARTIVTYYELWRYVLTTCADLLPRDGPCSFSDLPLDRIDERLKKEYPRSRWWLFQDICLVFAQLDLLEKSYVTAPAGLSTLKACQILLRACYPPSRATISERLQRLNKDLGKEDNKAIDGSCSLCTGVAVSVLSLAGQENRQKASKAFDWLKSLSGERFAYNQAAGDRHSFHYTAQVLEGFCDHTFPNSSEAESALQVFFSGKVSSAADLYNEHMRYRNVEEVEVASYIYPSFLRYLLIGHPLDDHRNSLAGELNHLVSVLQIDAESASLPAAELYSAQSNLGSLVLGAVLGCEPAHDLAHDVVHVFHAQLRTRGARSTEEERLLWDSSVDRTLSFIEGYLQ